MTDRYLRNLLVICFALATTTAQAQPLSSAFTYRGELSEAGQPSSGAYDFRFRVLDGQDSDTQVGPTLCVEDVSISEGRFATTLDFGDVFRGQRRYLEISVRTGGVGSCANDAGFTTLLPRQELGATPYAIYAIAAGEASSLGGQPRGFFQDASNMTTGTLPDERLSGNIVRSDSAPVFRTGAVVGDQGLTLLRAGFPTARLTLVDNVPTLLSDALGPIPEQGLALATAAAPNALFVQANGDVGIGTSIPSALLHVAGDARVDGSLTINGSLTLTAPIEKSFLIPACAFQPANSTQTFTLGNRLRPTGPVGFATFYAPVMLPEGAQIIELAAAGVNTSAAVLSLNLMRQEFGATLLDDVATVRLNGSTPGVQTSTQSVSQAVLPNTAYVLEARMQAFASGSSSTQELLSVRIRYTTVSP